MRTIATLREADSCEIWLDGLNALQKKDDVRRLPGYLPQELGVYTKMSAVDILDHIAVLKGITGRGERKDVVESPRMDAEVVVDWEPARAGIDPYHKLIDRKPDDNTMAVGKS